MALRTNIYNCLKSGSSAVADMLKDFLGLFFPRACLACSGAMVKGEEIICTRCRMEFPRTDYHLQADNPIEQRLAGRIRVEHGWAFLKFKKEGIVQKMLHHLKYNDHPEVGVMLGKLYGHELRQAGFAGEFDLIVPVPLHPSRKKKRGYNQSAAFAEGLSFSTGIPWDETVSIRTGKTVTQTRKTKLERWENVKDVFAVDGDQVRGLRVLLVDDVITTGATLEACGRHIISRGCLKLSMACIAEAQ